MYSMSSVVGISRIQLRQACERNKNTAITLRLSCRLRKALRGVCPCAALIHSRSCVSTGCQLLPAGAALPTLHARINPHSILGRQISHNPRDMTGLLHGSGKRLTPVNPDNECKSYSGRTFYFKEQDVGMAKQGREQKLRQ